MKNRLLRVMILQMLIVILFGCSNSMKKDASELVNIQKQKNETVRQMLGCRDSLRKLDLLKDINRLESRFNQMRKACDEKYNDSADKADFEQLYIELLKSKSN